MSGTISRTLSEPRRLHISSIGSAPTIQKSLQSDQIAPEIFASYHLGPGDIIGGKYTLLRELGHGGTATVYSATDIKGATVAVKVINNFLAGDVSSRSYNAELNPLSVNLNCSGLPQIIDHGISPYHIVMEQLEGSELLLYAHKGDQHRLPLNEAISIIQEVCKILSEVHAKGIIHRDIKPDNIFRTVDGKIKLLDFGQSVVTDFLGQHKTNKLVGTPAFAAPEQISIHTEEKIIDNRADIYAVAATLYTILTNKTPYDTENITELLYLKSSRSCTPIQTYLPDIPSAVADIIHRALDSDRAKRHNSIEEFSEALHQAAGNYTNNISELENVEIKTTSFVGRVAAVFVDGFSRLRNSLRLRV